MQPTYLPWCGYFALIQSVDIFVFLDSVQFSKRSWQQRNQIKTMNGAEWMTVPVLSKGKREQKIYDVEIDLSRDFSSAHKKIIEANYSKASYFNSVAPNILDVLNQHNGKLAELNIALITSICKFLSIETPLLRSSQLDGVGEKADLLASLCNGIGAREYISAIGSKQYLDESSAFDDIGVPIRYFNYEHPEYFQLYGKFQPYMSVLDVLFNCGDQSAEIIKKGVVDTI